MGSVVRYWANDLEFLIESLDICFLTLHLQRPFFLIQILPDQIERWLIHRWHYASSWRVLSDWLVSTSHPWLCFRYRGGFLRGQFKVIFEVVGLVLPNESLGSWVVDVEEGRWLNKWPLTSLIDKPSIITFLRNLTLVLIGIFTYLQR